MGHKIQWDKGHNRTKDTMRHKTQWDTWHKGTHSDTWHKVTQGTLHNVTKNTMSLYKMSLGLDTIAHMLAIMDGMNPFHSCFFIFRTYPTIK